MSRAWYQGLLSKLPTFDPAWAEPVRAAWWNCFRDLLHIAREMDSANV